MILEGQEKEEGKLFIDTSLMLEVYKYCIRWEAMLLDYKLPEELVQTSMTMASLLITSRLMKIRNEDNLDALMKIQILRLEIKMVKVVMWMAASYPNQHGILPWLTALDIAVSQSRINKLSRLGEKLRAFRQRGRRVQTGIEEGNFLNVEDEKAFIKDGVYIRSKMDPLVRGILTDNQVTIMGKVKRAIP